MATSGSIGFIVKEVPDAFRERSRIRKWLHRVAQDHGTRIDAINLVLMTDEGLLYYHLSCGKQQRCGRGYPDEL